jgi:hypothetical protein
MNYDKGVLAEILEPIMGKGLIPADLETWKVGGRARPAGPCRWPLPSAHTRPCSPRRNSRPRRPRGRGASSTMRPCARPFLPTR